MLLLCFWFGNIFVKNKDSLAPHIHVLKEAPVIELETIDSTNNYAMQLIDADTAQEGLTITAREQTAGKGQRGRIWKSPAGQNLMMSMIVVPRMPLEAQFIFNATVTLAIADALQYLNEQWSVAIKWPNDILINDKKAGGILIENVLRGNQWTYAIVGLGLNVLQAGFPPDLPHATSLYIQAGKIYEIPCLLKAIREKILVYLYGTLSPEEVMAGYNDYLYRRNQRQLFSANGAEWGVTIVAANPDGTLRVLTETGQACSYQHGSVQWVW